MAITLTGDEESYVDFYLDGKVELTDLAFSLLVYPLGEPKGTLLNYLCNTGNVIRASVLEGLLIISFWDEYGVSVGATAVSEVLISDRWHHLLVSREYNTGRIKVFHNGELIDDIDDDFPNKIRLPSKGSIRLGSAQKDTDDKFKGRFSCFQLYTSLPTNEDVRSSLKYCNPDQWKIHPQILLEQKTVGGVEKLCVADYVVPREDEDLEPKSCDVLNMACLTSELNWDSVLLKNKWSSSLRDSAYFHLIGRDKLPSGADGLVIGDILVTEKKLCSRLCLRVNGCQAFSSTKLTSNTSRCIMYQDVTRHVQPKLDTFYYSLS
ncbi:uncharacterized protein LOC106053633 isoform X2 [Biomphalaria glabrata]|uniref:Uncharacterized protein LOC106053633 isoform X2 n=1 Tax=Biomphalaria glabrata TaxID=6526 RepID=A0A9W3AVT4_BIOGL|nr:uncharacterized protein LOC106053633 isoform X2 [Biomphalaria glabrata]